jgi:hypothetical protein
MRYRLQGSVSNVSRLMEDYGIVRPLKAFSSAHEILDVLVEVKRDDADDFEFSALEMSVSAMKEKE